MKQTVKVLALLLIFLLYHSLAADANDQKQYQQKGRIVDTIRCKADPKISYALYLPTVYSADKKWPVIFVFDPAARGTLAVRIFSQAAEELGFIIVGSNNSKNQMGSTELELVINSMFADVRERFSIDRRRMYTSGFSGGSRVASMIALQNNIITGVIGCGAGFVNSADLNNIPFFSYYGLVGNRDMNYLEMCDLVKRLDRQGKTAELRTFNGGHTWPSPDLLQKAVEWMHLQSMNKGIINKDSAFIKMMFDKYRCEAAFHLKNGKLIMAVQGYENLIKDFPDFIPAQKFNPRLDSLKKSAGYIKEVKAWDRNSAREQEIQNNLISTLVTQARDASLPDSIRRKLAGQIRQLKNYQTGKDTINQIIASRVLMMLNAVCYETGRNFLKTKKYKAASVCFLIESMADSENNYVYFNLSKSYALDNDTGNSLNSLDKAIKLGFNNRQAIEKDSAFIVLKNKKRFDEIMMNLK